MMCLGVQHALVFSQRKMLMVAFLNRLTRQTTPAPTQRVASGIFQGKQGVEEEISRGNHAAPGKRMST